MIVVDAPDGWASTGDEAFLIVSAVEIVPVAPIVS